MDPSTAQSPQAQRPRRQHRRREYPDAHPKPGASTSPPHVDPSPSEEFLAGLRRQTDAPSLQRGRRKLEADSVRHALIRNLAAHSHTSERLSLVMALILSGGLLGIFPTRIVFPWMGAVVGAVLTRAWIRRHLRLTNASPERFLREFRWSLVPMGLSWAVGPLAMAGTMSVSHVAVSLVLCAGLLAAATASLAPDRPSFTVFSVSLMLPMAVAISWTGFTPTSRVLLALMGLFTVAMHVLAGRTGATLETAVRTQEALRRSERAVQSERGLLDALIRSAPTAIVAVDSAGMVLGINPAFEELFGWSASEVQGKELDSLVVAPPYAVEARQLFRDVSRGEVVTQNVVRQTRDGTAVPVRVSAARTQDSLVDAVFVLYENRSVEVNAHQALAQAEEHYRDLVESSLDLVWKVDISGRWTFLNAASEVIYGAPPSELVGTRFADRVAEDRRESDLSALLSVLEGHPLTDYETVHHGVDGAPRTLSFTGRPFRDRSGAIVGAQGTARDVSERAAIRQALEEARELALHNANDKTTFLANMSHEIRTPMNAVIGMIEILLESELTPEQRRHGEVIRSSAGALLSVIDDILDFSKLEANHLEVESIPFAVRGLVDSTTRLFQVQAEKKGLRLHYVVDPGVPDRAVGDPARIRQVCMNLIGNAIKFTHEGIITLRVSTRPASGAESLDRLLFTVEDTGIGVAPDKIESIFDHFTQADPSTTRQYGGTGLGLAICKGFVGAMGGAIWAESTPGVGSQFMFWIPLREAPALEAPVGGLTSLAGRRALLVEADPDDRADIEGLLTPLGVSITVVGTAQDALRRAVDEEESPDIILLDRAVSGMDGFELAGELRTHESRTVPIVMLSSEPRIGEGARCRELGIDGYLPKPVNRGDLLEIIGRVLSCPPTADTKEELVTRHSIAEARRALNILLVEDNPLNQEVASALLQKRGHTIDVVDRGTDAVSAVLRTRYDLVLMDIQLPGIDGVEATRRIRSTSVGADLPIVALTAHAFGEERERALAAGMNDFLTKPFRPHELFAVVEGWLPGVQSDAADRLGEDAEDAVPEPEPAVDIAGFREEMREVGIESVVDESLALFMATASDRIDAIVAASTDQDLQVAAAEAHGFKSSAGTIRAMRLHGVLDQLEDAANAGEADEVLRLASEAAQACNEALVCVGAELEALENA